MFKIESYISPIIINYIDKYVKDFRPQNAQVSLWGGEVSFQNLDIRLDVLQEELHLPLNIVSGHIHELTIRVPWTKIASEPIQINVNTIEFAVKLKSDDEKKEKDSNKIAPISTIQEPPGYMASLINKIANNISIKLNNIIFKYIEDDIVLSMNVQTLSIDSADENWNPAFIDINPVKVLLRKVINVNDLTICLDKRNAQGKIEVCQEPILYRCTLQARMIRRYNLSTIHLDSNTRIDIFTDNIDFKISVQQFPLLIRIYLLMRMLRDFHTNIHTANRAGQENVLGTNQTIDVLDGSYTTWIWNMLPELFPNSIEEERLETHGHIFHNGFYAKNINITLKSQEIVSNSIIQTNTIYKYYPILKITLSGVSCDTISIGRKWHNIKGGISYIGIFPLGNCACNKKHNLPTIFISGRKIKGDGGDNVMFLFDSLKDPNCSENKNQNRLYENDFQSHIMLNTEEALLNRCPAFAMDIVNYRQTMDDTKSYGSHSISSRDYDTVTEEYFMRILFGKFIMKIDTSLLHLYRTLNDHYEQYTYTAPYLITNTMDPILQLWPPSTEDYESLIDCIPLRKTCIYFKNSTIEYYHLNDDHFQNNEFNEFKMMPYILLNLNRAEFEFIIPLHPEKLINTTCQLPDPTEKLKENCFNRLNAFIDRLTIDVVFDKQQFNVSTILDAKLNYNTLIQPDLWKIIKMPNYTIEILISEFRLTFNKPQFVLLNQLMGTGTTFVTNIPIKNLKAFQATNICHGDLAKLEIFIGNTQLSIVAIDDVLGIRSNCGMIVGLVYVPNELEMNSPMAHKHKVMFFSNETFDTNLMNIIIQYPINLKRVKHPPIVNIEIQKTIVNFDKLFQQFLIYEIKFEQITDNPQQFEEKAQRKVRKSSKIGKPLLRTESIHSNSITTMSIVTSTNKIKEPDDKQQITKWYELIKQTIVCIDIKSLTIVCADKILYLNQTGANKTLKHTIENTKNVKITTFRLPSIALQSSKYKNLLNCLRESFPIDLMENWMLNITSFPWNIELNDFSCETFANNELKIFLPNVNTTLTLDLTSKEMNEDEMSFVIHLDTTPIRWNLDLAQIEQITDSISSLTRIAQRTTEKKQFNPIVEVQTSFYDAQVNEFICETTNSERSSEEVVSHIDKSVTKIHCLMQWTITKFTLSLMNSENIDDIELLFEMEDIIMSVDKQSTYTKTKTKFGSMNGMRKKRNRATGDVDILNIISRSNALITDVQETFFELIATTAIASNVHSRWGATTKKAMGFRDENDTITEITIVMQSIDIKLELDVLTVILAISNKIRGENTIENSNDKTNNTKNVYCVKDLPLLFFDCKGLQLWLPNTIDKQSHKSDVVIIKVNAISIAPSVENPIHRKPVREDIYMKAAQLRMIYTPGSVIEDRQYELLLKKCSIVTGNWHEILQFTYPANNENPAFDWNNQTEKPSLNVNTILNDLIVSIVYAPAIIFQNIIVCGQAIEFNCISDLVINLTLDDIILLNVLRMKLACAFARKDDAKSSKNKFKASNWNECGKTFNLRTIMDQFDNNLSDSGFKSQCNQDKIKNSDKNNVPKREIPCNLSFVGGFFTFKMYKSVESDKSNESKTLPLISMQIMQPNMISIQDSNENTEQFSLFNLSISLHDQELFETKSIEFGDIVFDTHRSELNDTGIVPTLFEWKRVTCRTTNITQIQCNMKKPIQVQFTPTNVEKLLCLKEIMQRIFYGDIKSTSSIPSKDSRPIVQYNKIKEIRKLIGDTNNIEFNVTKISINFMTSMDRLLSIALFKWNSKINVQEHPEQIMFATNADSLAINTQNFMLLNPTSFSIDFVLSQEKWNHRLLILSNFKSNRIHLQINPYDFWTFAKIQLDFWSCVRRHVDSNTIQSENIDEITENSDLKVPLDNLEAYHLPALFNDNQSNNEEYFQDDLRLGTFEYIVISGDNALPLPYQIYLLNQNPDMQICWRYPHPRTINFIQIYPIPGQIDVSIKCRLEYYQESHNTFFPYVLFEIGNKKVNQVTLPKQKLTAAVWRIVIIEPVAPLINIDVDEMNPIHDIFTPRTIISCIRIDSMFNINNVPKLQANIKVNELKLSVFDSVNCVSLSRPEILSRYTLKVEEGMDVTQEFCEIEFGDINFNVNVYSELQMKIYNELTFGVRIFDASYLTLIPLIDKVSIGSYIEINKDDRPNVLHLTADKLSIRYGPPAGYAFSTMKNVWQDTSINTQKPILSRFVICNATSVSLKFGQEFTDEAIWLRNDECFYYAFRTQKSLQRLKFSVKSDNDIVDIIESYPLNDNIQDDPKPLKVTTNKFLMISARKLSTTQKQIIIKGQIELMNMTNETFQIHYKDHSKAIDNEIEANNNATSAIYLQPMSSGSFFEACDESCDGFIRLNVSNNGWSGEVPLHKSTTNIPWLVKVPIKNEQKFITFSVRIHSEYFEGTAPLNQRPKRILVVIWPLFSVRSLMPTNLNVIDQELNRKYEVKGRGGTSDLQIAGTFDTEHSFAFNTATDNDDLTDLVLTYKNIDKKTFFTVPIQYKNISDIIKELEKPDEIKWPCSLENESSINRACSVQTSDPPLYKCSASRSLSCALKLEIAPSCLFINSLGFDVTIVDSINDKEFVIQSNHIAIPSAFTGFALKFKVNNEMFTTSKILISNDKNSGRQQRSNIYLPEEGSIQMVEKCSNNRILKICLTSSNENSMRIISIQPFYVICNFSKQPLKFRAFCIHRNETMKYDDVAKLINEKSMSKLIPDNSQTADNIFKGCDCSIFCDISKKAQKSNNYSKDLNFYMVIQHENDSFSSPIFLNKPIVRTTFGMQLKSEIISLAASITQHKEQYFVSIYNDRFPFIEIDNQTNIEIFTAEADFGDFSKIMKPKRSMHDENFQWCCSISPYSRMFYSPPSINERFPEKQNSNIHLIFGCGNSKLLPGGNIQWSIPVETNKMDEKYLALPLYGDIKLTSFIHNKTVKIRLQHINFREEFNVKVVHNKLSSPNERFNVIMTDNIAADQTKDDVKQSTSRYSSDTAKPMTFSNFNTIIFIKQVVFVLYDDYKDSLHKMNYIASIFFDDMITCYTEEERKFEFGFRNIQIDNNLYSSGKYDFPVILCGQNDKKTIPNLSDKNTFEYFANMPTPFSLPLMQNHLFENQIGHFEFLMENTEFNAKEVVCSLQPLRVYIEDKFIAVLLDFAIENLPSNIIYMPDKNECVQCAAGEILMPKFITEQVLSFLLEPLRLNRICIKPLSILLSVHTCMRMYIALDHSPLHFAQFEYKNIYTTTMRLGYNIGMHYVSDAIFGAGWVVGSLEILGSPSGLARSVSSGLWDFVSMPVQGLMRGPWGVLLGITYGSASLIKNITAGTVNSVTKLAASVARNLDRLTLDDEHLERTEALRRVRPMGITHGISQGLTGFGINLLGAVGGIARHALEAKSSVEVFTGLGKGIIGVVTKPISGAAELLALTGQGVLHTVGFNAMPLPRDIKIDEDHSFPLSVTKVAWKILSKIDNVDSVLVVASASHVEGAEEAVTVAITSKLILLIADSNNELATVLNISRTRASVDIKNSNRLMLVMKSDEDHQQFHHKRILQYLSKTHVQAESRLIFEDEIQSYSSNESNRNILICKDPHIASYLARYIQFLYYCLNIHK